MGRVNRHVRDVSASVDPIEREWHRLTADALDTDHPRWVVLGDSTAQAIGATGLHHGWVHRIADALSAENRPHAVVNLSRSGAGVTHVIDEQLPLLDHLEERAAIVTICVGANDLMRNPHAPALARKMIDLAAAAPTGSIIATLPSPRLSPSAVVVNRAIRQGADAHGHRVADLTPHLSSPFKGLAKDRFHPNDLGYQAWVRAFAEPLDLDQTETGASQRVTAS